MTFSYLINHWPRVIVVFLTAEGLSWSRVSILVLGSKNSATSSSATWKMQATCINFLMLQQIDRRRCTRKGMHCFHWTKNNDKGRTKAESPSHTIKPKYIPGIDQYLTLWSVFIELKIMTKDGAKQNLHPTLLNQDIFLV